MTYVGVLTFLTLLSLQIKFKDVGVLTLTVFSVLSFRQMSIDTHTRLDSLPKILGSNNYGC
jgi:hypothetical protein